MKMVSEISKGFNRKFMVFRDLRILYFEHRSHIAAIFKKSFVNGVDNQLAKSFLIGILLTLLAMMSLEFVLQHENGTPHASLEPKIEDEQLKYRLASQSAGFSIPQHSQFC